MLRKKSETPPGEFNANLIDGILVQEFDSAYHKGSRPSLENQIADQPLRWIFQGSMG